MQKIDWARKLTSRKFWAAIGSFATMLIVYFGGTQATADKTAALIMAGATVVAYIIGEGLTDIGNKPVLPTDLGASLVEFPDAADDDNDDFDGED